MKNELLKVCGIFLLLVGFTVATGWSQKSNNFTVPLIGEKAPAFSAESTNGNINFPKDFGDNWKVIFCHPKDYTPVCSSELLELSKMQNDFEEMGVSLVVVSTDRLDSHKSWKKIIEDIDHGKLKGETIHFPLVADDDKEIAKKYGMIHHPVSTTEHVRGVYIIGPDNKIEATLFYPMAVGRNMKEIQRAVLALQEVEKNNAEILTPANWNPGDDVLLPYLTKEQKTRLEAEADNIYEVTWFMQYKSPE